MQSDGSIDYRHYTLQQLREALSLSNRKNYPLNLHNLEREIASRTMQGSTVIDTRAENLAQSLAQAHDGRPKLVWAITVFSFLSAMLVSFGYYVSFSGRFNLPAQTQQQINSLTTLDHAQVVVGMALKLMAAVYLFRLRKMAPHLFTAALVLGVVSWLLEIALSGWAATAAYGSTGTVLSSFAISTAICIYSWHLHSQGRLR